jgi:hypothetical protein
MHPLLGALIWKNKWLNCVTKVWFDITSTQTISTLTSSHALGVISKNNPPHDSFGHGAMGEVVSAMAAQLKSMATT